MANITIRTVNGKTDIPHLFKQLDREEKQYRKKLASGLYHWMDSEILRAKLGRIQRFRAQYGEASGD